MASEMPNLYTSGSIPANQSLISRLKAAGVQLASDVDIAALSGNQPLLSGKTFVITGTLPTLKRDEAPDSECWWEGNRFSQ